MVDLVKGIIVIVMVSLILFAGLATPVYALANEQSSAIQTFLDEASRKSGVPGISISIIYDDEVFFFSSGYSSREARLSADENTLYELASVSKAFTGVGILLLEEQGLISMDDPINKYLPWLTLKYNSKYIDMSGVTLNHFLHHTSGLTNGKHFISIPEGNAPDMLIKSIEALVNAELAFLPGTQFNYGTMNYNVLAMVIETVTGQSFENFMQEQVFVPLGLYNTYLYADEAKATGNMAQGYRTSFFITTPYDAPEYGGNKAAGYVISSAYDMARWMGIHLGTVTDIPEIFRAVVAKSHEGNNSVENNSFYAAGWGVNEDRSIISHGGSNPTFKTNVVLYPNEQTAICLLSNGSNMDVNMIQGIKEIIDGSLSQSYQLGGLQLIDVILSCVAIAAGLLAVMFVLLRTRRKKQKHKRKAPKIQLVITIFMCVITIVTGIFSLLFPRLFGMNWLGAVIWMPLSMPVAWITLFLLVTSITWFVFPHRK